MDERHSAVPTAAASYLPPPVRRSVIPRPADAAEPAPLKAPLATPAWRPRRTALALLLLATAALGVRSLRAVDPAPGAHAVRPLPGPAPVVVAAPVVLPSTEAAAAVEPVPAESAIARRHHRPRHHRPLLASAERPAYTLILLP